MRNFLILLGLLGAISIIYLASATRIVPPPKLISSTPRLNSTQNNVTTNPTLHFDIPVLSSDFQISSVPEEEWVPTQADNQTITLVHKKYLYLNTKYTISLNYKGAPLPEYVFTTASGQSDPRFLQEIEVKMNDQYPLMEFTPYSTPSFSLVYSAPLTLEVTLKNNNISSEEAISQAKAWVTKNGGNPSTHKYLIK